MNSQEMVQWMTDAISTSQRSVSYFVAGAIPDIHPELKVNCVGPISFPLKPKTAKELIAVCRPAPFGKGRKTIVDKKVRRSWELDPKEFGLSAKWEFAIRTVANHVAEKLGLPTDQLQPKIYKMLIYERGGFFLPHRDSEKLGRMVASLVVVLPSKFSGGELIVGHGSNRERFTFQEAATAGCAEYVAFYADCQHEINRVTSGYRICLTYNLMIRAQTKKKSESPSADKAESRQLTDSIQSWTTANPGQPLVFALEHHYTDRGLKVDLLKGADRQIADLVVRAAEQAKCQAYMTQIQRHLVEYADDGSLGGFGRYGRWSRESHKPVDIEDLQILDTIKDDVRGDAWRDIRGKRQPFGAIAFDPSCIVSSTPLNQWKPTSADYEGYTGNAGNELDRWYHRSAIAVWHMDRHFDVVAKSGTHASIELFLSMTNKLEKTPKNRLAEAIGDCKQLARAIIARWPSRLAVYHNPQDNLREDFALKLIEFDDTSLISDLLAVIAERDSATNLKPLMMQGCRKFGVETLTGGMRKLLAAQTDKFSDTQSPPLRDIEWLSAVCCDRKLLGESSKSLAELCSLVTTDFCNAYEKHRRDQHSTAADAGLKALPFLIKALIVTDSNGPLARLIAMVRSNAAVFSLEASQVPLLTSLLAWSKKTQAEPHPALIKWLNEVRLELEALVANEPKPPADWARPAYIRCKCDYCKQLNQFLGDPMTETAPSPRRSN